MADDDATKPATRYISLDNLMPLLETLVKGSEGSGDLLASISEASTEETGPTGMSEADYNAGIEEARKAALDSYNKRFEAQYFSASQPILTTAAIETDVDEEDFSDEELEGFILKDIK